MSLLRKIRKRLTRFRVRPIRVFCAHQVCDKFDAEAMWPADWIETTQFKSRISCLLAQGYRFISLKEAYSHICNDWVRRKKYAVLTFDDGAASVAEILPWLENFSIPVTLFVNPAVLSGAAKRSKPFEVLSIAELQDLEISYASILSIGNHGFTHVSSLELPDDIFRQSVEDAEASLSMYTSRVPFYAYPYGKHTIRHDRYLLHSSLIPVLCDGQKNYTDSLVIHRELL